jgi:hypothetical protein
MLVLAGAALLTISSVALPDDDEREGRRMQAGNGPGPGPLGPGAGCNLVPAIASVGTVVDISEFPPPDSVGVDPRLAGPVQLLRSGKFDIPIETLTRADVPDGAKGTVTLPLYKGSVQTPAGPRPAWYVILDASTQEEADRLGVNFAEKLENAGDAARRATLRSDGTFQFESGLVDFSPDRVVEPGPRNRPFPPRDARPGSIGDEHYSPLVTVGGVTYDAPIIAAAVEDGAINFPNGNPNYDRVHDQVVAIDPVKRTVTLNLINGFSFGKPVLYISSDASDPTIAAIEGNTLAPRLRRLETGIDDVPRSAVERIFIAVNGPSRDGCDNPQRQGVYAALNDGHRPNNVFGGIPTVALDYSPVWDGNAFEWTDEAIRRGYRGLVNEEFRILQLARDGYITGLNGAPFGSAGFVIVCGVAARLD